MKSSVFLLLITAFSEKVLTQLVIPNVNGTENTIPEDAKLNFIQLSIKYGHPAEEHFVITEDGYNLTVFRIPGTGCPVFLQHGIIDSATTFIIRGYNSLAITLAKAGYDVWLGNMRGSRYSRRHITLNPDKDKKYWDFRMHEIAIYDMTAMIDLILKATGNEKLAVIGHSEGNAVFFALGSTKPEYNDKISVLIALAPICYLHHVKPPLSILVMLSELINDLLKAVGQEELLGDHSAVKTLITLLCSEIPLNYEICGEFGFLFIAGFDTAELEKDFLEVVIWHYPVGTSRKNVIHMAQIAQSKRFQQYDYGIVDNLKIYGTKTPPEYNLNNITMNVELFMANNDKISTIEDVRILRKKLRNVNSRLMKNPKMNHLDFVWGLHMDKYLFPLIFKVLEKYCKL